MSLQKALGLAGIFFLTAAAQGGVPQFEQVANFPGYVPSVSAISAFALNDSSERVPAAYFFNVDQNVTWFWVTDGTSSGTHLAAAYPAGTAVTDPVLGAYVTAQAPGQGLQLYKTQGPEASSHLLVDAFPAQVGLYGQLDGNPVYETSEAGGDSIWIADGTNGTTQKIGALYPLGATAVSDYAGFTISGQSPNYVVSTFSIAKPYLQPLAVPPPDTSWIYPHALGAGRTFACLKNLHQETPTVLQEELFCTDGTAEGTRRIIPPSIGTGLWLPDNVTFTRLGSRLLFITHIGTTGDGPWITDGTDEGTYPLFDAAFEYNQCTDDRGGYIYFVGAPLQDYPKKYLWRTDGTKANTKLVMQLESPNDYCPFDGGTSFGPSGPTFLSLGPVLYQTDGNPQGTFPVVGAPPGSYVAIVGNSLLAFQTGSTDVTLLRLDLDEVFEEGFGQ